MKNILKIFSFIFLFASYSYASDPYFDFTGNPGFAQDGAEPNYVNPNSQIRFEMKYIQDENIPPAAGYPLLKIKKDGMEIGTYLMMAITPADTNYTAAGNGKDYFFISPGFGQTGVYEYYFQFKSTNSSIINTPSFWFNVLSPFAAYGDFSSSSGAVAGTDMWDEIYDSAWDNSNKYLYVLGYSNPFSYIIKYSSSGAFMGRALLPPDVSYKKLFVDSGGTVFAAGDFYDYQSSSNKISVSKFNSSMVFVSSRSYFNTGSLWFGDMAGDASNLYFCSRDNAYYHNIIKLDYSLVMVSSYTAGNIGECEKIAVGSSDIFTINNEYAVKVLQKINKNLNPGTYDSVDLESLNNYSVLALDQSDNIYVSGYRNSGMSSLLTLEKFNSSLVSSTATYQQYEGWSFPSDIFIDTNSNVAVSIRVSNNGNDDYGVYLFSQNDLSVKNYFSYDGGAWDNPKSLVMDSMENIYLSGISDIMGSNGMWQSDIRTVKFKNDLSQNRAPYLQWLNSGNYWYRGVYPENGSLYDTFYFKVTYKDLDNDPTEYIRIRIYNSGEEISGSPFLLSYESGTSTFTGITYSFAFAPSEPGYYSYRFEAADRHAGAAGLPASGYPAQMSYGPNVGEGFSGNLSLSTGAAFTLGGHNEPEDITVLSRSGEGDYVYALAQIDQGYYILKFSTGINSVAVSSQIVSFEPTYEPELLFSDKADNFYLAGKSYPGTWSIDLRKFDKLINNTKSSVTPISDLNLHDGAVYNGNIYVLYSENMPNKDARIAAFDSTLTHIYLSGGFDLKYQGKNYNGTVSFEDYPQSMSVDSAGNIYVAGYYYDNEYSTSSSNNIFVAKFDASNSYAVSSFTFTSPGTLSEDKAYGIDIDNSGNVYVAGMINNGQKNLWLVLKLDNSLNLINTNLFDGGDNGEISDIYFSTQTGRVFLSGVYSSRDTYSFETKKGLSYMLDSNLTFLSSYTYSAYGENNYFGYMEGNSSGQPYILGLREISYMNYGGNKITAFKPYFNVDKTSFTLYALKKSDNSPMKDMNCGVIAYNSKGTPDTALTQLNLSDNLGKVSFQVDKGINYQVVISTPGFGPKVRDQFFDPYGNFSKIFNTPVYSTYTFSPLVSGANTLRIHIKDIFKGALLMGEVYFTQNNERAGYAILKATDSFVTMEIHNLPAISAGTYGIKVNMPGFLEKDIYPFSPIPSTYTFVLSMKDAYIPSASFTQNVSSSTPFFSGLVTDSLGNPLSGAAVRAYCNCITSGCTFSKSVYTDLSGRFAMYGYDNSCPTGVNYYINRLGYDSIPARNNMSPSFMPPLLNNNFTLITATYSISGYVKYMGNPLAFAKLRIGPSWITYSGNDSYAKDGNTPINIGINSGEFFTYTNGDGYFNVSGLTDGNLNISVEYPIYNNISGGIDGDGSTLSDNFRITISSQASAYTPGYPCIAGKVWVLDSTGTCKGIMPYVFDIGLGISTNAAVMGNLTFASTYTVSASNPLIIDKSSSVVVGLFEQCDGNCSNRKSFFSVIYGTFTSNIIPYSVSVSSWDYINNQPINYWLSILSNSWAKINSFDDTVYFSTSNIVVRNMNLVKSGRVFVTVKNKDGSVYLPPQDQGPEINLEGETVSYGNGNKLRDDGTLEFPNVPGGKYSAILKFNQDTSYVPIELENITVNEGKTTNIVFTLKEGLYVQPQIYGLPIISTPSWSYTMVAVPSGQQMNSKFVTEMFFEDPLYSFDYDVQASTWSKKVLPEGRFDFYLLLGAKYCTPGDNRCASPNYTQFANFIGRTKNIDIKYDSNFPNLGTSAQPISVNILGSLGQFSIGGTGKGLKIFTDSDYERLFADFQNQIISLIPSVMLYDTAGELRAFSHIICDENGLTDLMNGVMYKDKEIIKDSIAAGKYSYYVWGLPPGQYTAVFSNPNYPPITRTLTLPDNENYDFDFDSAKIAVGNITGVVRSSDTASSFLSNAMVYLKGRIDNKYTVTDSSGRFSFLNMPAGSYKIEISMDGFAKTGKKFSLGKDDTANLETFYLKPAPSSISGKIYVSKFPSPTVKEGVKIYAYDETENVSNPQSYLPLIEDETDESGNFSIKGIVPGHNYKLIVSETGKMTFSTVTYTVLGDNNFGDIYLIDLPPQITVKLRKDPDNNKKVNVSIQSPKELVSIPSCRYNQGTVFIETAAVSLALVPAANNTFMGQFTISSNSRYYTLLVSAGDSTQVDKTLVYDSVSNSKTEQYVQNASLLGGNVYMDSEKEEYSGLELDAGALTQTSTASVDMSDLAGGFFSALPNVRTVKTNRGDMSIADAVKNIMASEIYDIDLSNAQANKSFSLTLKYDKEKAASSGALKIYQYDSASGLWKEVPGTYDIDPTLGIISVGVDSLEGAYEGATGGNTPMARKFHKMSAVSPKGYYTASSGSSSQSGKFAVFSAKPPSGTSYSGSSFEIYNMPNPFNLKDKTVAVSDGWSGVNNTNYVTRGTIIKYFLPSGKSGSVKLVIYNNAGEKVRTLDEGSRSGGQVYYSEWDGKNDKNEDCASGVYFLMPYINGDKLSNKAHKMALIK